MSLETVFTEKFEACIEQAYRGGARAAPMGGFGFALGSSLTYIAEGESPFSLSRRRLMKESTQLSCSTSVLSSS
jgi:hypothetical protein